MPTLIQSLLAKYTEGIQQIYGRYLKAVILYGSYARGDFTATSDVDIMILLDLNEMEIKQFRHQLSNLTFEFNMEHDTDIKPIAKSMEIYTKWLEVYPFYQNIDKEGVMLYHAA